MQLRTDWSISASQTDVISNRWVSEFRCARAAGPGDQLAGSAVRRSVPRGGSGRTHARDHGGRERRTPASPNPRRNRRLQFAETISFLAGSHHLKAGLAQPHRGDARRAAAPFRRTLHLQRGPGARHHVGAPGVQPQPAVRLRPGLWQLGLRLSGGRLLGVRSGRVEDGPVRAEAGAALRPRVLRRPADMTTSDVSGTRPVSVPAGQQQYRAARRRRTTTAGGKTSIHGVRALLREHARRDRRRDADPDGASRPAFACSSGASRRLRRFPVQRSRVERARPPSDRSAGGVVLRRQGMTLQFAADPSLEDPCAHQAAIGGGSRADERPRRQRQFCMCAATSRSEPSTTTRCSARALGTSRRPNDLPCSAIPARRA